MGVNDAELVVHFHVLILILKKPKRFSRPAGLSNINIGIGIDRENHFHFVAK